MDNDAKLDDQLAALTDALLAGSPVPTSPEIEDLAQIVQLLHEVIEPEKPPGVTYHTRLSQHINREWNRRFDRRPQWSRMWKNNRGLQLGALAAAITLIMVAVSLFSGTEKSEKPLQGTALGSVAWVFGILVVLLLLGMFIVWLRQRTRS